MREGRGILLRACLLVALGGISSAGVLAGGAGAGDRLADLRTETTALGARSSQLLLELSSIDAELAQTRARLGTLRAREGEVAVEQAAAARRLSIARRAMASAQTSLGRRVRALYEESRPDPLATVLAADSLASAITDLDHLDRLAELDTLVIEQAESAAVSLGRLRASLAARRNQLRALAQRQAAAARQLAAARDERVGLLERLLERRRTVEAEISGLADRPASAPAPAPAPATSASAAPAAEVEARAAAPYTERIAGRQLAVTATAYSLRGTTATGVPVGPGIVAVDPSVIPLGTRMTIPGYGEGVAADTGGSVRGARIDVWLASQAEALAWGTRTVTITLD